MSKIKLLKVNTLEDGTVRLQSQLLVGTITADFIIEDDILKCYGHSAVHGWGFYPYNEPYEIVENKADMAIQEL
jgi:hypothetical protein